MVCRYSISLREPALGLIGLRVALGITCHKSIVAVPPNILIVVRMDGKLHLSDLVFYMVQSKGMPLSKVRL